MIWNCSETSLSIMQWVEALNLESLPMAQHPAWVTAGFGIFSTTHPFPNSQEFKALQNTDLPVHSFQGGCDLKCRSDFWKVLSVAFHICKCGISARDIRQISRTAFVQENQQMKSLQLCLLAYPLWEPRTLTPPSWSLLLLTKSCEKSAHADFLKDL